MSCTVWRTTGCSGISIGPVMFSWQAAALGKSAAIRSSASIRWMGGGFFRPPRNRSTISARLRFQRQRDRKIGWSRTAWVSVSMIDRLWRNRGTSASGKLWCGPRLITTVSSFAEACSSKLKLRQNFFRSAYAHRTVDPPTPRGVDDELHPAGLVEEPLEHQIGLCRQHAERGPSRLQIRHDGLCGVVADTGVFLQTHRATLRSTSPASRSRSTSARSAETSADSSTVRAGASPSQKGIVGGRSPASTTRTCPSVT